MHIHICLLHIEELHGTMYKELINGVINMDKFLGTSQSFILIVLCEASSLLFKNVNSNMKLKKNRKRQKRELPN